MDTSSTHPSNGSRINLLQGADVAYWCRVFNVDMSALRQAVQQVGPQAQAVHAYLARQAKLGPG